MTKSTYVSENLTRLVKAIGFCSKRGNYSEKQRIQNILLSYYQALWLLYFRSANGKQDNSSSKKKNLKPQIKGVFNFRLYLLHLPLCG